MGSRWEAASIENVPKLQDLCGYMSWVHEYVKLWIFRNNIIRVGFMVPEHQLNANF